MNFITNSRRPAKSGFTLIELLVVIAIIAILAAMLLPALSAAELKGTQATCLSNINQLGVALNLYASEFNDSIVPDGNADGYWNIPAGGITWDQTGQSSDQSQAAITTWLKSSGVDPLYQFAPNIAVIHCPGDVRYQRNPPGAGWAFDSYSKTQNLAGDPYDNYWGQGATLALACYAKYSQVKNSSQTFCFKEDCDDRGYNEGTWVLNWDLTTPAGGHSESFTWEDINPMYHGNVSTAAFMDGHAEGHKWTDSALITYGKNMAKGTGTAAFGGAVTYDLDYGYIYDRFRFPGWKE